MRQVKLFDKGWRFHLGDICANEPLWGFVKSGTHNQTGARSLMDDSGWREVNLPHDFIIEGTVTPSYDRWNPKNVIPEMWSVGNLHTTRGSFPGNIAWYRKSFEGIDTRDKRVYIRFDGIYRDSDIYLNDFFVGRHLSGYTGVTYDITDFLYENKTNTLAVRVDATKAEGWFYEGGGIYRHVWIIETPLVAVDHHGVCVKSNVNLKEDMAELTILTTVHNAGDSPSQVGIRQNICGPDEKAFVIEEEIVFLAVNESREIRQSLAIEHPMLWDIEAPNIYKLTTSLSSGDEVITEFGIRDIRFDKDTGFYLNGKQTKLKGVCCHQDHAGLGVALPDGVQEYRIRKLKDMGCNAYRCAHNPATEELLQVCDRMGMLVMNENRLLSSSSEDLAQLDEMVLSTRNHPSIFIWSLGNEEGKIHFTEQGKKVAATMRNHVRRLDGTRPTTVAVCMWDAASNFKGIDDPSVTGILTDSIDVFGFNYFTETWDKFRNAFPEIPLVSTEHTSLPSTRGCRNTENERCHLSITDPGAMCYGEGEAAWQAVLEREYIAGIFVWTGFDYHGEPSPYGWPAVSSQFGIMDLCGFPKDGYFYYKAAWSDQTTLYLCRDDKTIWCFTNCDEVEFYDGSKTLGRYQTDRNRILKLNDFPSSASITAIGELDGIETARYILEPYDCAEKLVAEADGIYLEKNGTKTVIVNVKVCDSEGRLAEDADNIVNFTFPENAVLLGTGNGDPSSHENAKSRWRRAFNGRLQAIFSVTEGATITIASSNKMKTTLTV